MHASVAGTLHVKIRDFTQYLSHELALTMSNKTVASRAWRLHVQTAKTTLREVNLLESHYYINYTENLYRVECP